MITELLPNQVFVFGSDITGHHMGGAARYAVNNFGAIVGKGVGKQGQSYAIPTMQGLEIMKLYVRDFVEYARANDHNEFLVTEIGCGIAGYTKDQIAPMFYQLPNNVILPKGWQHG